MASIKFQYDNEGRIKSYEYSYNHHTDKEATISYSGNKITIVFKPKTDFTITANSSIWYTQQYSNKVDFSNATLLAEFGVIFNRGLPLNKAYTNLPDKIVFTDGTGRFYISDDLTFFPFSSVGYVQNKTLKYDSNGFLSSISNNTPNSNKTEFFYNN